MNARRAQFSADPIELLKSVNPVPASVRRELAGTFEGRSAKEIVARASVTDIEPESGSRSRRRRLLKLAALTSTALIVLPLVVGAAFGIGPSVVSFFDAPEPDQEVKTVIFSLAEGAPPGMDPGLLPESARVIGRVPVGGDVRMLWAAPTSFGGFCHGWVGGTSGCDKFGTTPLNVNWARTVDQESVASVDGFVNVRYASVLELHFEDGHVVRPPLLRVSDPIKVAFFVYAVPRERQTPERTLSGIVARDQDGQIVAQQQAPLRRLPIASPLADALVDQRQAVLRLATRQGEAIIWVAPTRYEGRCAWVEFHGQWRFIGPCKPARYEFDPFAVQPLPARDGVLIAGTVSSRFDSLLLEYEDGDRARIRPERGFVLYEIPATHLSLGSEARTIIGYDRDGQEITRVRLAPPGSCWAPLPATDASLAECPVPTIPRHR